MEIRLMTIAEEAFVLSLWEEKSKELLGPSYDKALQSYRDAVKEMLGHANVYVLESEGEIKAFASLIGGYYISNFFVNNKEEGTKLMKFLQERYEELQIDLHQDADVNAWIEDWGFRKLGSGEHDVLGYPEHQYEWLR